MASEHTTLLRRRWNNLLAWVSSHGLQTQDLPVECREMSHAGNGLFARTAREPGSLLFVIPSKALMNKMTLRQLYPPNIRADRSLTAVQLISMHLFVWRPEADEDSADPSFGPYISILPRDFRSHPLTWLVLSELGGTSDLQAFLLESLPPSVLAALHRLHARFWADWCKVRAFLQTHSTITPDPVPSKFFETIDTVMDFLWAWLNVNTRSMFYRLKHTQTDPDNVTLCPILDFANHTPSQAHMTPLPSNSEVWNAAPVDPLGDGLKFVSFDNAKIEENTEILLTYGLHSNKTLFVEYGFVNPLSESGPLLGGDVDVQDLVEEHIFTGARLSDAVRSTLVIEGYWGDWTLHSASESAQPSWRLITALRLFHLVVAVGSADEGPIQPWRDVITGKQHQVSCENEQSWRKSVILLCDKLIERAERSIAVNSAQTKNRDDVWARWMLGNIQALWKEELIVARVVKECVLRGDEF